LSTRHWAACVLLLVQFAIPTGAAGHPDTAAGAAIYLRGVTSSGAPLEGARESGLPPAQGAAAACVSCHKHSGLGITEGTALIPPVSGRYLYHPKVASHDQLDLPYVQTVRVNREPYNDATLARAIREGIDSEGKPLGALMPRFALNDADMASLIAYLKTLDPTHVAGVSDTVLQFATIVTPDADPVKRRGMLEVLEQYFKDKNTFPIAPGPRLHTPGKGIHAKSMYMANRRWQLHVWELTGPASTWGAQLDQRLAKEPVLAVVSGMGGTNWAPVHEFCKRAAVPCLFPNLEVPVVADQDFYSLYFSRGVLLEAELIAARIGDAKPTESPMTVHQAYRAGDSGEAAAQALEQALQRRGISVESRVLPADGEVRRALDDVVRHASAADALVLWLRFPDIESLGEAPGGQTRVFVSGLMGGLDRMPLPAGWRAQTRVAYPVDLPDKRVVRVDYPLGWFAARRIAVVAEQVQVDTFLACGLLAETVNHMSDIMTRDYLVERLQDMLGHRILTGYYPHLSLAEGQRFASKGGYLVRIAEGERTRVIADGGWVAP